MCLNLNRKEFTKTCWPNVVTSSKKNNLTKLFLAWDDEPHQVIASVKCNLWNHHALVGGWTNLSEKYQWNWIISPSRDEIKNIRVTTKQFCWSLATLQFYHDDFHGFPSFNSPFSMADKLASKCDRNATQTGIPKMSCCFFLGQVINKWGRLFT